MSKSVSIIFAVGVFMCASVPSFAAGPAGTNLEAAISQCSSPVPVIGVGAGVVMPRAGQPAPGPGLSPAQIADAYGEAVHSFGPMAAVGPASIPEPADPADADPMQSMSDAQTLAMFTASLEPGQWDAFRNANGIGIADLSSDAQIALFRRFFRAGTMQAAVNYSPNEEVPLEQKLQGVPEATQNSILTAADIENARLRLGVRLELQFPIVAGSMPPPFAVKADETAYIPVYVADDPQSPTSVLVHTTQESTASNENARPNPVIQDDLDTGADWAKSAIMVRSGETVAELLQTIRGSGGPEVYADPQMETRKIALGGTPSAVDAGDLLKAVAFAVGGAYRKVGVVYDLVFDLQGLGRKWVDFADSEDRAEKRRRDIVAQAVANSSTPKSLSDLSTTFSPLGVTQDQFSAFSVQSDALILPITSLSPPQQEYAGRALTKLRDLLGGNAPVAGNSVRLVLRPYLQAILPSMSAPAEIETGGTFGQLFGAQQSSTSPTNDPESISTSISLFKRRALIAHAATEAELTDIISSMSRLRLNELWLQTDANAPALIPKAIAIGKEYAISVCAYVDVLDWGGDAPAALEDETIIGDTGAQGGAGYVSPIEAEVKSGAVARVRRIREAAPAGLSGIVLGSTEPPGYAAFDSAPPPASLVKEEFGYAVSIRQAFIRKKHADPIDLLPPTSEPFDKVLRAGRDRAVDDALWTDWAKFRHAEAAAILEEIIAKSPQPPPSLPVLVQRRVRSTGTSYMERIDAASSIGSSQRIILVSAESVEDLLKLQAALNRCKTEGASAFALDLRAVENPAASLDTLSDAPGP